MPFRPLAWSYGANDVNSEDSAQQTFNLRILGFGEEVRNSKRGVVGENRDVSRGDRGGLRSVGKRTSEVRRLGVFWGEEEGEPRDQVTPEGCPEIYGRSSFLGLIPLVNNCSPLHKQAWFCAK